MSSILVTGANGFVGRILCAELLQRQHSVRAALRNSAQLNIPNCTEVRIPDINAATNWAEALKGIDCVIHLAARVHVMRDNSDDPLEEFRRVNVSGTEHLARSAAASGVKRLVYVSSIKVNGEATYGEQVFNEDCLPAPEDAYGLSKWEAEQTLSRVAQETGLEVVIVRPPLIYGPGVKGNFEQMLMILTKGIPLPLAWVRNRRSLVFAGNLSNALILCANHPAAKGQTYLISDMDDISTPNLLRQLASAMGFPVRLIPFPPVLLKLAGALAGKPGQVSRLLGSLRVSNEKIRTQLGWTPPYSLKQGLQITAEWYRNNRL